MSGIETQNPQTSHEVAAASVAVAMDAATSPHVRNSNMAVDLMTNDEKDNEMSALPAVPQNDIRPALQVVSPVALSVMEQVIIKGNLAELSPEERVEYYMQTCKSIGLNPLSKPFDYLELDGAGGNKTLTLYAKRDCTDQLRRIYDVTTTIVSREVVDGVYIVTARASLPNGRTDESIGAVPLMKEGGDWKTTQNGKRYFQGNGVFGPLGLDARANAIMKCETKAKRRVTLSICGLGWLDESEVDTIASARTVEVDHATGVIAPPQKSKQLPASSSPGSSEITDWTVFWGKARAKKIDKAIFTDLTGQAPQAFSNPQAAWDALLAAEAKFSGGAAAEAVPSNEVDGQYIEVDHETGEVIGETDYEAMAQE